MISSSISFFISSKNDVIHPPHVLRKPCHFQKEYLKYDPIEIQNGVRKNYLYKANFLILDRTLIRFATFLLSHIRDRFFFISIGIFSGFNELGVCSLLYQIPQ